MVNKKLKCNEEKDDFRFLQELFQRYKEQVYYTSYSIYEDKVTSDELLKKVFLKAYLDRRRLKQGVDTEDWLYSVTVDVIREFSLKNNKPNKDGIYELMGFEYEFPSKARDDNPTEEDYSNIFKEVCKEIDEYIITALRLISKLKSYAVDYWKVAAVLVFSVVISFGYIYRIGNSDKKDAAESIVISGDDKSFTNMANPYEELPDYNKTDRITVWQDSPVYTKPHHMAELRCLLKDKSDLKVHSAVLDSRDGTTWLKVSSVDESFGEVEGWIQEGVTGIKLAESYRSGKGIKDEEIWTLVDGYLSSLCGEEIPEDQRILRYTLHSARASALFSQNSETSRGHIEIEFECEVEPYNTSEFKLAGFLSQNESEDIQFFKGRVELYSDTYLLTNVDKNEMPLKNIEFNKLLKENGLLSMAYNGYSGKGVLPGVSPETSDQGEILRLYIAYCNELSKAQGYDLTKYMGEAVNFSISDVVKGEDLDYVYNIVVVEIDEKLCGVWLEAQNNYTGVKEFLTLDGGKFDAIVRDKKQWLRKGGFKYEAKNFERILELTSLYNGVPLYNALFTYDINEFNTSEYIVTALDKAVHIEKDEKLIKDEFLISPRNDADLAPSVEDVFDQYLRQFKNKNLSNYSRVDGYETHVLVPGEETPGKKKFNALVSIKPAQKENLIFNYVRSSSDEWMRNIRLSIELEELDNGYKVRLRQIMLSGVY
jgi:DNA-directed RNA polymerase specialized sigma24 family protein